MNAYTKFAKAFHRQGAAPFALAQLTVPVRDTTRGTIPIADLVNPVSVFVPKVTAGNEMKDGDEIQLARNGVVFGATRVLTQAELDDPNVTEFEMTYAIAEFPPQGQDVTVNLDYFIGDPIAGSGQFALLPLPTRFDRRAPGGVQPSALTFTEDQLRRGILDVHLVNDELIVQVNGYTDIQEADEITLWLGTDPATGNYLLSTFTVTDPYSPTEVKFTRQELAAVGATRVYFGFRGKDWAGNVGALSSLIALDVFINLPALPPPVIDDALDGLLTYNEAVLFAKATIPQYPGAAEGDLIIVEWGGVREAPYRLSAAEVALDPMVTIQVTYAVVAAGSPLPYPTATDVKYYMQRTTQPEIESPPVTINVDLSTPGGPTPDPTPDPEFEHDLIQRPDIRCGNSPINTIGAGDYGQDATMTVHRVRVGDAQPIWAIGDVIQPYWSTVGSPEITSQPVTIQNEGANIDIPIPFANVIERIGVGTVEVYFTLTRTLAAGPPPHTVTVRSPKQSVVVASSGAFPGDGNPLAAGSFPEAIVHNSGNDLIQRAAGLDGTYFRLPLAGVTNIELSRNPRVNYDFVGISTGNAVPPPPEPWAPIEMSRIKVDGQLLQQTDIDRGYVEVQVPYAKAYYICRNGATLNYSITNDVGTTPGTRKYVYFALNDGGAGCDLPSALGTAVSTPAPKKRAKR